MIYLIKNIIINFLYLLVIKEKMNLKIRSTYQSHPFHLVSPSPWPFFTSMALWTLTSSGVSLCHGFNSAGYFLISAFLALFFSMLLWWRDVISEATYLGNHTLAVQRGLIKGIALFIVSEALFFLAIFWAYFHCCLSPVPELGAHWPPMGIETVNPYEIPLFNTIILLASGFIMSFAHHSLIQGMRRGSLNGMMVTVLLAVLFTGLQGIEYSVSCFTISDGIFGSSFYLATGFHGFHVIVGTLFILIGLIRHLGYQPTNHHHLGLEFGILYWHFVDVIWIALFFSIYCWGS